jgi:steroid delta-isomerase
MMTEGNDFCGDSHLAALVDAYETLTPARIPDLVMLYDDAARFKDPFNDVLGPEAIARIFTHMFETLRAPKFSVDERMCSGQQAFLTWRMEFYLPSRPAHMLTIAGATHLRFASDGKIVVHRDYWDAAEELYEKLPMLGPFMRWLRRQVAVNAP